MSLQSLLYISHSKIAPQEAARCVEAIVDTAMKHNPPLGLTGALLFTGTHFAQVLEGIPAAIDELMGRVVQDSRHDRLLIVERAPIAQRRFDKWSMAYFGPSRFVSRHVTRLLHDPLPQEHRRAAQWLTELMREFSAT